MNIYDDRNPNRPKDQSSVFGGHVKNRFKEMSWPPFDIEKQEYLHIGR